MIELKIQEYKVVKKEEKKKIECLTSGGSRIMNDKKIIET